MTQEIENILIDKGYDKIFEEIEENGYQIGVTNIEGDKYFYIADSLYRTKMCKYETAEDIMKFTDKFVKMFLQDNDEAILSGMKNIQSVEEFYSHLLEYIPYNEADICNYFILGWENIPNKEVIYDLFKDCLSSNESNDLYNKLMQPKLIKEVMNHNQKDTTENQELIGLLDAEGYLTIYHGHVTKSLKNHNSWTIKKEVAEYFGNRNALFNQKKEYYVVCGRVKLKDIITYITDRNEFEIVVPDKCVDIISREQYKYREDFERPFKDED